jgi:hypothetical protein
MRKIGLVILIGAVVLALSGIATAAMLIPADEKAKEKARTENSPVIEKVDDYLVLTPPGLGKIVFIHYKKGFARPSWAGGGREPACYDFLGKWVKWKELPVSYVIDPTNPQGLSEDFITNAISAGAEEWDYWTGAELFNDNYNIIYDGSWDSDAPDGRNELLFGDYPQEGVIAVTVVWGYFAGPPELREIIEFDVMFDIDYLWGDATLEPTIMDLQNIATHEIGHGAGLDDVYDTACSEVTMYGYSDYGEINKRTLEQPDITGIQELYGSL